MPTPIRPGDQITATCRRCGDVTGHIVMLVLNGAIAKVECRACGSAHKYRDAQERSAGSRQNDAHPVRETRTPSPKAAPAVRNGPAVSPPVDKKRGSAAKQESAWREAMVRQKDATAQTYSMHSAFQPHTLLEHPLFGRGEILDITKPDKMRVLFQDGVKILRCRLT